MSDHPYRVRRATIEDLAVLRALWTLARLPVFELEPRLTEFQIAVRDDGVAGGALGLRVEGWHGWLHSPGFYSASEEKNCLPALWRHVQQMSQGKGVARFWIAGPPNEFWRSAGFQPATTAELKRLPASFRLPAGRREWWTLAVRNDDLLERALERDFARLQVENRAEAERLRRLTRVWTWVRMGVALGLGLIIIWLFLQMLRAAGR